MDGKEQTKAMLILYYFYSIRFFSYSYLTMQEQSAVTDEVLIKIGPASYEYKHKNNWIQSVHRYILYPTSLPICISGVHTEILNPNWSLQMHLTKCGVWTLVFLILVHINFKLRLV